MNKLTAYINEYIDGQYFSCIVRSHSEGVNIDYHNSDPIIVEITNVVDTNLELVGKTVSISLTNENPVRGNFSKYVMEEADGILIKKIS